MKIQLDVLRLDSIFSPVVSKITEKIKKTNSVRPSRMTIGIFCYRHPSFMMRQDASMGRFDAISRFPVVLRPATQQCACTP